MVAFVLYDGRELIYNGEDYWVKTIAVWWQAMVMETPELF